MQNKFLSNLGEVVCPVDVDEVGNIEEVIHLFQTVFRAV
jgi:hypothetical protein